MGRQIRFHIVQEDANELINFIYSKGGIIINENENGAEASEDELLHIMDKKYFVGKDRAPSWCVKLPNSNIVSNPYNAALIICSNSEVLELSFPDIRNGESPLYDVGRIWYEKYAFENGAWYLKEHESELTKLYNSINYYIRKNYRLSVDKFSYIGKYAYELYKSGKIITTVTNFNMKEIY